MRHTVACSVLALALGCTSSDNTKPLENPRCVIWRWGTITDKDYAVLAMDYEPRDCEHIARLLNADEHMHGSRGPDFRCKCVDGEK
jgi:hypothetical protein